MQQLQPAVHMCAQDAAIPTAAAAAATAAVAAAGAAATVDVATVVHRRRARLRKPTRIADNGRERRREAEGGRREAATAVN